MEFHNLLKKSIDGESEDISRYETMAAMAPEEFEPILHDIAKEERQHLHFLNEIAEKTGWRENEEKNEEENHGNMTMNDSVEKLHKELDEIKTLILEVHSLVMMKYPDESHSSEHHEENKDSTDSDQIAEPTEPSNPQNGNGNGSTMPTIEDSTQRIIR